MENSNKESLSYLIEKAKKQDREAVAKLARIYAPLIKKVIRYYGIFLDRGEREDLFLEGLLAMIRAISTYDEKKGPFENMLFISVRNAVFDMLSKKKRIAQSTKYIPESDFDIEETVILKDEIKEFSNLLTSFEKEVFLLYLNGYKIKEIANKTGKSYKSIDNAIQRIRQKARDFIK